MPMIDVFLEIDALSQKSVTELCKKVSKVALEHEGFNGSDLAESLTWIYVHFLPKDQVFQASGKPSKPLYRFAIHTLSGLLTKHKKHSLASQIARLVYEAEGSTWDEEEASNRVWVLYEDKHEGDWIDGTRLNSLSELRQIIESDKMKNTLTARRT